MDNIFAVIKRYEQDGNEFKEWCYHWKESNNIYYRMILLTDNDNLAKSVLDWVVDANVGDIYEFGDGEVEIMEID